MCDSVAQLRTKDDEERCLKENKRDSPLLTHHCTTQPAQCKTLQVRWGWDQPSQTGRLLRRNRRHWGRGGAWYGGIWWRLGAGEVSSSSTFSHWIRQCMDTPRLKHSAKCLTGGSKSSVSVCQDIFLFNPCSANSLEKIWTLIRVYFGIISLLTTDNNKGYAFQYTKIMHFSSDRYNDFLCAALKQQRALVFGNHQSIKVLDILNLL